MRRYAAEAGETPPGSARAEAALSWVADDEIEGEDMGVAVDEEPGSFLPMRANMSNI
jgi:hypothetical protein